MTQTVEQPAESFPNTPLTTRLLRRISEPLGVIDVRHPEFLQERSTAGIVQRLELLNQWKTRYGLTAPNAPVESASVTSAQPFAIRSPSPGHEVMPKFRTPQQLRVKHTSEIRPDDASAPRTSANHPAVLSANNQAGTEASAPVPNNRTAHLRDSETVASPGVPNLQVARQPEQLKGDAENPATIPQATVSPDRSGSMILQQSRRFQNAAPVSPSGISTPPASPLPTPATPLISQTGELLLRRKVTEQSPPAASTGPRSCDPNLLVARSTSITPPPGSGSFAHTITAGSPSPAPIFLARKTGHAEKPPGSDPTAPPAPAPNFAAIAQEISAAPSAAAQPSIVWRRADPDVSPSSRSLPPPISTAPAAQIMRSSAGISSSGLPAATLQSSFAPSASHSGVDVEHLAERVSRVIARQLTVERERRGVFR